MVQSLNTRALITLTSVLRRPYLMSPHVHVPTISQVNYTALKQDCGIRAVVFDKDNTITAPYATLVHDNALFGLQSALDTFGHENVAIFSNSAGTKDDPDYNDAKNIEKKMGISVIRHDEKKPGGLKELLSHFNNVSDPTQVCMVGDRLLTDIVFGNLHGMLTVHCLPLCVGEENRNDNKVASAVRNIENKILYGKWFVGKMIRKKTLGHAVWEGEKVCSLKVEVSGPSPASKEIGSGDN